MVFFLSEGSILMQKEKNLLVLLVSVVVFGLFCVCGYCGELNVPSVPYPTIQSAIDVAVEGDRAVLASVLGVTPVERGLDPDPVAVLVKDPVEQGTLRLRFEPAVAVLLPHRFEIGWVDQLAEVQAENFVSAEAEQFCEAGARI